MRGRVQGWQSGCHDDACAASARTRWHTGLWPGAQKCRQTLSELMRRQTRQTRHLRVLTIQMLCGLGEWWQ